MGLGDNDTIQSLFGNSSSPGILGTGQQRFDKTPIGQPKRNPDGSVMMQMPKDSHRAEAYLNGTDPGDPVMEEDPYKKWQDPQYDQNKRNLNEAAVQLSQRRTLGEGTSDVNTKVTQAQIEANKFGGATVNPIERYSGANVGQFERGQQAQLSPAERIGNINIGQAQGYGGAQIDPAAQARAAQLGRQDAQFRGGQTQLMSDLQEQSAGRGPSLAGAQLREATDRNLKQQAALAATSGGSAALAQRNLGLGAATQGQEAARAAATMRMQEQLSARQQLAGVAQTGRAQDIEVANAQAQLQQQTSLANQAAINARAGQQAGLTQQAGMFSAEALNSRQMQQAQLNAQLGLANQAAGNQFALQQGQFGQQMNLANMQSQNERTALQAQMQQQAGLAGQSQANQAALAQSQMWQQAGLANQQYANQGLFANQQAALQNQQMNDAMLRYYSEAGLSLDARQQQAMMAAQSLEQQRDLGYAGLSQKSYEAAREGIGGMMGGIGGMAMGAMMMSDEEVKDSVTRGDDKISGFLDQYMKGIQDTNAQNMAPEPDKKGEGGLFGGMAGGMSGGMMAGAMSDKQSKDLTAENNQLRTQMVGMQMQKGSGGKGLFGGMGGAMANYKAPANAPTPKADISAMNTNPVMNNPNMAIAMPQGTRAGIAPATMVPGNSGGIIRENPYPNAPVTTGVAPIPNAIDMPPMNPLNPYEPPPPPMQTWSDKKMKDFLDKQHAYEYEYKDEYKDNPMAGEGRYVSPMAQDLQKTELGKSMVQEGPDGKLAVDYGKALGTMLAGQAYLNERLNEMEAKKGKR